MRKTETASPEMKLGSIDNACLRYGIGKNVMREIGKEANAVVRVGRRYLLNFTTLDQYFDSITGIEQEDK